MDTIPSYITVCIALCFPVVGFYVVYVYLRRREEMYPKYISKIDDWLHRILMDDNLFGEQESIVILFFTEKKVYEPTWWMDL